MVKSDFIFLKLNFKKLKFNIQIVFGKFFVYLTFRYYLDLDPH
jgi:hypothetical protein